MSRIHGYSDEDLFRAALDRSLPVDQQVLIVEHLARTEKFKKLPPHVRISFFTAACSRAKEEIAAFRNNVSDLSLLQEMTTPPDLALNAHLLIRIETVQNKAFEQANRLN